MLKPATSLITVFCVDGRGDDLILDTVVADAKRLLAPHMKLLTTLMVGFEDRVQLVQRTLALGENCDRPGNCRVAGVYGMGGVGKTTLALAVHDQAATQFSGRRIFFPVGEECNSKQLLRDKRCKFLQEISGATIQQTSASEQQERLLLRNALGSSGPLLLVLDDLWTREQLCWLLACEDSEDPQPALAKLPAGSRVVLTSRSREIVTVVGHEGSLIHLEELDDQFSQQLLCHEAFAAPCPPPEFTADEMKQALNICGGLPLALQVLGRLLKAQPPSGWKVRYAFRTKIHWLLKY